MKILAHVLLKLMTAAIPVVIAACYGPSYRYYKSGKVVDKQTGAGISAISVTCQDAAEKLLDSAVTTADGSFILAYDTSCARLLAEDTDGELNGAYVTTSVPFDEAADSITIEMPARQN